ncbi:pyridoxamine 5'-phosphate oxidase-domain-containing protein [Xylariaceae sp. FL0255]|nr:pyridoxamine 5'-phosphate oxidase-domain-containing protein [Xylariaceae sp. FL0255]
MNPSFSSSPLLRSSSSRLTQLTTHLRQQPKQQLYGGHHIANIGSDTTTMTGASPSSSSIAAPWRKSFMSHIETMDSPEFVLSTIHRVSASRPSPPLMYVPRARTCIFRGLWADLNVNPKNDAPLNPAGLWTSDLLTFTTDCRMEKMEELFGDVLAEQFGRAGVLGSPTTDKVGEELWEEGLRKDKGKADRDSTPRDKKENKDRLKGCGGGAPVEAVFWIKEPSVQWRFRGRAYVIAPDVETSPEGREVMTMLQSRMRKPEKGELKSKPDGDEKEQKQKDWSFARELTAHFGNCSPVMRGTFRNPPPGQPISSPIDDGLGLGQKVTDLDDPVARANFRVVVIVPGVIDCADLSDGEHPKRWIYTYVGGGEGNAGGDWEVAEVWP